MQVWALTLIAVSLSMDALAVSICKGLSLKKVTLRACLTVGLYFGIAQALMPLIGYLLASTVAAKIADYAYYIAFILLVLIGANMIREALTPEDEKDCCNDSLSPRALLPLAVATSIDALAVGVSFALLQVDILFAVSLIGIVTALLCFLGVALGSFIGSKFQKIAAIVGGGVLIFMGTKILLEGLHVL